jgi:Protein of unknown function (DUF3108)
MIRIGPLLALLCLACLIAPVGASGAQLNYTLYVLGVPLADAAFTLNLTPAGYGMAMRFYTTGLADLVASDRLDEHVSGRFEKDGLVPMEYVAVSRLRGQDRVVNMIWRDGTPTPTTVIPPNAAEREDVPEAPRVHAIDPLSSIVLLLHQVSRTGRCDASARAFDGRRLEVFQVRTAGEEELAPSGRSNFRGRALRCDYTDRTLAGFRLGSGRDDDARERRGTIWLSGIFESGPRLPVRATIETRLLGDAVLYLTNAAP